MIASSQRQASTPRAPRRGFTLIELMVTVAVIGILAKIALPSYLDYVKRGKLTEAFNQMSTCSISMGQYYQDNRSWAAATLTSGTNVPCPTSTTNFTYSLSNNTATGYLITASGSTSATTGFSFTIDNFGNRVTTGAPSGWPTASNCWVASKSGCTQ